MGCDHDRVGSDLDDVTEVRWFPYIESTPEGESTFWHASTDVVLNPPQSIQA